MITRKDIAAIAFAVFLGVYGAIGAFGITRHVVEVLTISAQAEVAP